MCKPKYLNLKNKSLKDIHHLIGTCPLYSWSWLEIPCKTKTQMDSASEQQNATHSLVYGDGIPKTQIKMSLEKWINLHPLVNWGSGDHIHPALMDHSESRALSRGTFSPVNVSQYCRATGHLKKECSVERVYASCLFDDTELQYALGNPERIRRYCNSSLFLGLNTFF